MAIKYICPMLGERTVLVFSEKAHQQELSRLKGLGYEITHPVQDDAPGDSTNAPAPIH